VEASAATVALGRASTPGNDGTPPRADGRRTRRALTIRPGRGVAGLLRALVVRAEVWVHVGDAQDDKLSAVTGESGIHVKRGTAEHDLVIAYL
jgi:hypothetical protein